MSDPSPPAESRADSRPPRSYLGWGLAATVLCFVPLGLVTLYYGFRTNRALLDGRIEDAIHQSHVARGWLVATVVVGLLVDVTLVVVVALLGAFSS
jgi:Interferon-induced transmembrane protein